MQSNSAFPSRKSRNSGLWFSRQRLRRPPAKASRNRLRVWETPRKCSWSGAFSYAYAGEIIISSTSSSSLRKSSTSRTVLGESCVKNVVLVVTRKPPALATLIAATALSNTPSRSTEASCRSRRPSMWIAHAKYGFGVKLCSFFSSSSALVHR